MSIVCARPAPVPAPVPGHDPFSAPFLLVGMRPATVLVPRLITIGSLTWPVVPSWSRRRRRVNFGSSNVKSLLLAPVRKLDTSEPRLFEASLARLFPSLLKIGTGFDALSAKKLVGCLGEGPALVLLTPSPHWLCTSLTSIVFSKQVHFALVLDRVGRYVSLTAPSGSHGGESSLAELFLLFLQERDSMSCLIGIYNKAE